MKYKVTFPSGQVNHYETETPMNELANRFPGALVEQLGAPKAEEPVEAAVEAPKKRSKKAE